MAYGRRSSRRRFTGRAQMRKRSSRRFLRRNYKRSGNSIRALAGKVRSLARKLRKPSGYTIAKDIAHYQVVSYDPDVAYGAASYKPADGRAVMSFVPGFHRNLIHYRARYATIKTAQDAVRSDGGNAFVSPPELTDQGCRVYVKKYTLEQTLKNNGLHGVQVLLFEITAKQDIFELGATLAEMDAPPYIAAETTGVDYISSKSDATPYRPWIHEMFTDLAAQQAYHTSQSSVEVPGYIDAYYDPNNAYGKGYLYYQAHHYCLSAAKSTVHPGSGADRTYQWYYNGSHDGDGIWLNIPAHTANPGKMTPLFKSKYSIKLTNKVFLNPGDSTILHHTDKRQFNIDEYTRGDATDNKDESTCILKKGAKSFVYFIQGSLTHGSETDQTLYTPSIVGPGSFRIDVSRKHYLTFGWHRMDLNGPSRVDALGNYEVPQGIDVVGYEPGVHDMDHE